MIAPAIVAQIKHLLKTTKLSQRKIAKQIGVSRGTVSGVANGTRPDYEALRREREQEEGLLVPTGPLVRCSGCGGMVHIPCRLCHIRQLKTERQRRRRHIQRQIELLSSRRAPVHAVPSSQHPTDHLARTNDQGAVTPVG